ncbi:MAG: glycerophosphodiester phosphodiesterase family protein, partial [Pseudomonadota bacterium]
MIRLADSFFARPITHRGFHDAAAGRIENSPQAIQAAIDHGYGIEIDVQRSADSVAMVFHDYSLQRLTGEVGVVQTKT